MLLVAYLFVSIVAVAAAILPSIQNAHDLIVATFMVWGLPAVAAWSSRAVGMKRFIWPSVAMAVIAALMTFGASPPVR